MRIVFMGGAEFSVPALERLIQSKHQIVAVYTQPDRPAGRGRALAFTAVKRVALEHGLEVLQPAGFRERAAVDMLCGLGADAIVVAGWGRILPREVLTLPPFGCINLHPSLLPRHRGPSPVQGAILAGDEWTGVSIILMDEGVDSGPILAQSRLPIEPQDNGLSLTNKLAQLGAQLVEETLPLWFSHRLTPRPQPEEGATYTRLLSREDGEIDWHLSAVDIWRQVRAFSPWPGSYTRWQGRTLKVIEATPLQGRDLEPGMVVALEPGQGAPLGVGTGEGVLGLIRLQLEGKRELAAAEFLRGQPGFIGALLPSHRRS